MLHRDEVNLKLHRDEVNLKLHRNEVNFNVSGLGLRLVKLLQ